jgi:hypothetical protein
LWKSEACEPGKIINAQGIVEVCVNVFNYFCEA